MHQVSSCIRWQLHQVRWAVGVLQQVSGLRLGSLKKKLKNCFEYQVKWINLEIVFMNLQCHSVSGLTSTRTETDPMNIAYYQVHLGHVARTSVNGKVKPNFSSMWHYLKKLTFTYLKNLPIKSEPSRGPEAGGTHARCPKWAIRGQRPGGPTRGVRSDVSEVTCPKRRVRSDVSEATCPNRRVRNDVSEATCPSLRPEKQKMFKI